MAVPDALVVTGPHFRQGSIGDLLVTPAGGAQDKLANLLGGSGGGGGAVVPPMPIAFVIPGQPTPGAVLNVVMAVPCTLPANLAGTQGYAGTAPSSVSGAAGGTFAIKKIAAANGAASSLGAVSFAPFASRATMSQQAGASLAPGDVLQLAAPASPDSALRDVCVTILANRA